MKVKQKVDLVFLEYMFIFGIWIFPCVECQLRNYIQFEVEYNKHESPTIIYCNKTIEVNVTTAGVYFLNSKNENSRVANPCLCYLHDPTWNQQQLQSLEITLREHKNGRWIALKMFNSTDWGLATPSFPTFEFLITHTTPRLPPQFVFYTAGNGNFTGSQYLGFTLSSIVDTSVLMTCKPEKFDPLTGSSLSTSSTTFTVSKTTTTTPSTPVIPTTTTFISTPTSGTTTTSTTPAKSTTNDHQSTYFETHMFNEVTTAPTGIINDSLIIPTTPIVSPSTTTVAPTDNIIIIASILAVIVGLLIIGVAILVAFLIKYKRKERRKDKSKQDEIYDDTVQYGPYNEPDEIYDEIAEDIPDQYLTQQTNDATRVTYLELLQTQDTYLEPVANGGLHRHSGYMEPVNNDSSRRRDTYLAPVAIPQRSNTYLEPIKSNSEHLQRENTYLEPNKVMLETSHSERKTADRSVDITENDKHVALVNNSEDISQINDLSNESRLDANNDNKTLQKGDYLTTQSALKQRNDTYLEPRVVEDQKYNNLKEVKESDHGQQVYTTLLKT